MSFLLSIVLIAVMGLALLTVPLGVPGIWIMVAVLALAALQGSVAWAVWGVLAGLALIAEILEFAVLRWFGDRYGGSGKAFWGAVLGGFAGLFVGLPVPVVGSILTAFLGTFLGAALVTLVEKRSMGAAVQVGWGVVLARVVSVVLKVGVGLAILIIGAGALLT